MRRVLVLGEESSVIETVLPPQRVEVDPWISMLEQDEEDRRSL